MALRQIRTDSDPVLRKISKKVTAFDERLELLVGDMFDTMYEANGVGLAGVQVGVLRQVIVIDTGEPGECLAFINPEIIETEGEQIGQEGCLSLPGRAGIVARPQKVTVRAFDTAGREFTYTGTDLMARALCHEIDHLYGTLYIDKMTEEIKED